MKKLEFTKESEFVSLNKLVLEDNEKIKEIKSLYQREWGYASFLGPIESFIAYFYLDNPKIKDKEVIKAIKNIKFNHNKDLNFFKEYFEREFIGAISRILQENKKKITRHELFLILRYILWCIDNRKWVGDSRAYLNWITNFFGLSSKEEKEKFNNFYKELGKKHGFSEEHVKLLKNEESKEELSAKEIALSKLDSEKFSNYEEESQLWDSGSYVEKINPGEIEEKLKTIDKSHEEYMNYNCKKCDKKISAHNKDWHDNMCDECFNKTHHNKKSE